MSDINVFLSYSETKSANAAQIRTLIEAVRASIKRRGWKVQDAMEPGIAGISEDVVRVLESSDACIVEATTSSPNVMFEAGFARAFGYPTLFLVNPSAYDDPVMQEYFNFLKIGRESSLPADVGDVEYLEYSPELNSAGNRIQFQKELEKRLDVMEALLAPEARLLRRNIKTFYQRSVRFTAKHPPDHPLLGFVAGRVGILANGYDVHSEQVFETDARFYRECFAALEALDSQEKRRVRAVADLAEGTNTEAFWYDGPDPADLSAAERIFVVDATKLLDFDEMNRIHQVLSRHAAHYPVRLASKRPVLREQHPFGPAGEGVHLLLMEPDLVAGYARRDSGIKLRVERGSMVFRKAEKLYAYLHEHSVEVREDGTADELRRAWLELERIGLWDPEWKEHEHRPDHYFHNYDLHIRCWVPHYEAFIRHCANVVQRAISQRMRESDTEISLLEIGYGTGALTGHLLSWISHLNEPLRALSNPLIVSRYVGADAARRMQDVARNLFSTSPVPTLFEVGRAPYWPDPVLNQAPYDMICGSLVLHDLTERYGDQDAMTELLASFAEILSERGSLVFADTFFLNPAKRETQTNSWRNWMRMVGLNDGEINLFFERNPEMIETVTLQQMNAAAEAAGFEHPRFTQTPGSPLWSPFQVMRLRRRS